MAQMPSRNKSHSPQPPQKTSKPTQRSWTGCWTCRSRRKKCDEAKPTCNACDRMGLECGGYQPRLVWGHGVASRGHLAGATEPVLKESKNAQQKKAKRKSTSPSIGERSPVEGPSSTPIPSQLLVPPTLQSTEQNIDDKLLDEFLQYGCLSLDPEPDLLKTEPSSNAESLAPESKALMAGCLAYQTTLNTDYAHLFELYYADVLHLFRVDMCDTSATVDFCTLEVGLMLCAIGMNRRLPWTVHVHGLYTLLSHKKMLLGNTTTSRIQNVIDVLGFFDQPAFVVGRQSSSLQIWKNHCCSTPQSVTGLQWGLPRSLLRIFSQIGEPGAESLFWLWQGEVGDFADCRLWDAFRFAGMIAARNHQALEVPMPDETSASTPFLADRIMECIEAIRQSSPVVAGETDFPKTTSFLYPLFVVGCQLEFLDDVKKARIESLLLELIYDHSLGGYLDPYYETPLLVLREVWAGRGSADEVARRLGWEVMLV